MRSRFLAMHWWLVLGVLGLSDCPQITCGAGVPPAPAAAAGTAAPQGLDDVPEPLLPEHRKTQADSDHVEALSLFATGRAHEQREEFADALRCYQRALRLDPDSSAIAPTIIPMAVRLAVRLKRYDEAVRYALMADRLEDADPLLFRQLGVHLTEQGDYARAAILYEKALDAGRKPKTRKAKVTVAVDILLRMEAGRLCQLAGKYKPAAEYFARVLEAVDNPDELGLDEPLKKSLLDDPGPTYQLIGECFLAVDRMKDARAAFEKAEKHAPDKALRQFNLARLDLKSGKPAEALAALESAFAEHLAGEGTAPYETLAEALNKLGKSGALIGRLEKLRAAEPGALPVGYFLASQYRAAGKLDKAESLYRELLKNKSAALGYRALFDIDRQGKRFDALLAVIGESVEKIGVMDTLDAESRTVSGDAEALRGIVETARKMMKSAPDKFGYGRRLAAALLALEAKQYETAGEFFDAALATKPKQTDEAFMTWGVGLLAGDRAAEAAKVFRRAIDAKAVPGDNPVFYFYLAGALAIAGQSDEALAAAKTAAAKKGAARFRGRPAWVLYFAKRNDEAMKAYRALIDEFDADHDSAETRDVMREARMAISNLAVIKGDVPQAEEWLEQVLDEFPDDKGAMNDLGFLWADENKNLRRARRMIQEAVDAEPDNMAYRDSLGWVLFRLGKHAEAVAELEKAAADKKPDGAVLDHLGDAYQKANRHDKAVAAWRKAAALLRQEKEVTKASLVEKKIVDK